MLHFLEEWALANKRSARNDAIKLWSLKGPGNYCRELFRCHSFVASSGFSSDHRYNKADAERAWGKLLALYKSALA